MPIKMYRLSQSPETSEEMQKNKNLVQYAPLKTLLQFLRVRFFNEASLCEQLLCSKSYFIDVLLDYKQLYFILKSCWTFFLLLRFQNEASLYEQLLCTRFYSIDVLLDYKHNLCKKLLQYLRIRFYNEASLCEQLLCIKFYFIYILLDC